MNETHRDTSTRGRAAGRQGDTSSPSSSTTMASEASSEDDGGDFVSSSEEEEGEEVSVNQRIQTAGTSLSLSGEDMQRVPPLLMRLAPLSLSGNLTTLDLSSNAIAEIPRNVSRLRALRTLNLAFNKLTRLPSTIGASTTSTRRRPRSSVSVFLIHFLVFPHPSPASQFFLSSSSRRKARAYARARERCREVLTGPCFLPTP